MRKFLLALCASLVAHPLLAQDQRTSRFELEGGVLTTQNMEIRGYHQGNATENWRSEAPAIRLEYWSIKENSWNFGLAFQPIDLRYSGTLKNDLTYKGQTYRAGDPGSLHYQFPSLRLTANYPLLQSAGGSYLRGGGSAILRYADVSFSSNGKGFSDTNLIAIPTFNLEASLQLGDGYRLLTRSDFLPGIDGNVFLDGLFDVFLGGGKKLENGGALDAGIRMFFGGYDPKRPDDYANRIFFTGLVVRYSW
jgi:hypothetical protein